MFRGFSSNAVGISQFRHWRCDEVSRDHPVVISKYITGAKEVEMDGIGKAGRFGLLGCHGMERILIQQTNRKNEWCLHPTDPV